MSPATLLVTYIVVAVLVIRIGEWISPSENSDEQGAAVIGGVMWPVFAIPVAVIAVGYLLGVAGGVFHPLHDYREWRANRITNREREADFALRAVGVCAYCGGDGATCNAECRP